MSTSAGIPCYIPVDTSHTGLPHPVPMLHFDEKALVERCRLWHSIRRDEGFTGTFLELRELINQRLAVGNSSTTQLADTSTSTTTTSSQAAAAPPTPLPSAVDSAFFPLLRRSVPQSCNRHLCQPHPPSRSCPDAATQPARVLPLAALQHPRRHVYDRQVKCCAAFRQRCSAGIRPRIAPHPLGGGLQRRAAGADPTRQSATA